MGPGLQWDLGTHKINIQSYQGFDLTLKLPLLRSEMHQQEVSVRFGLILEAYCRSNELHLKDLLAQVGCIA